MRAPLLCSKSANADILLAARQTYLDMCSKKEQAANILNHLDSRLSEMDDRIASEKKHNVPGN